MAFYARRMRRLLPAALVVIVVTLAASAVILSPLRLTEVAGDAAASALYVSNFRFALEATDYLSVAAPSPFLHYWSLGVEEQFYLVWPLVLLSAARLLPRRLLGWFLLVLGVVSFGLSLYWTDAAPPWAFFSPVTRAWELAAGALLAVGLVRIPRRAPRGTGSIAVGIGLALIVAGVVVISDETQFPGLAALLPVLGATLVIMGGAAGPTLAGKLLANPIAGYVGRISYSLYLWHWPILILVPIAIGVDDVGIRFGVGRRGRAGRHRQHRAHRAALPARGAPGPPSGWLRPAGPGFVGGGRRGGAGRERGHHHPDAVDQAGSQGRRAGRSATRTCRAATPTDASWTSRRASRQTARTATSMARGRPCSSVTRMPPNGCQPWTSTPDRRVGASRSTRSRPAPRSPSSFGSATCAASTTSASNGGDAVARRIERAKPVVVFMGSSRDYEVWDGGQVAQSREIYPAWREGLTTALRELSADADRVVLLAETPFLNFDPLDCLADANVSNCDPPKPVVIDGEFTALEVEAAEAAGATLLTANDLLCPGMSCPVVVDDTVVFRDQHHVTASYMERLARAHRQPARGPRAVPIARGASHAPGPRRDRSRRIARAGGWPAPAGGPPRRIPRRPPAADPVAFRGLAGVPSTLWEPRFSRTREISNLALVWSGAVGGGAASLRYTLGGTGVRDAVGA